MLLTNLWKRFNFRQDLSDVFVAPPPQPRVFPAWFHKERSRFEIACQDAVQIASVEPEVWLARVLGCQKMLLSKRDLNVAAHLAFEGFWESWISIAMIRTVQPGWRCVDLGANAGYFTVLLAQLCGPGGHIWSVEPNPLLARLLRRTLQLNGLRWAELFEGVIADQEGNYELSIPDEAASSASIAARRGGEKLSVRGQSLDQLCGGERVDFIKIDVEGAEEMVWAGMQTVLDRNPHVTIFMEYNTRRYRDPLGFLTAIQSKGFSLCFIDVDTAIKPITTEGLFRDHAGKEVMLSLRRPGR